MRPEAKKFDEQLKPNTKEDVCRPRYSVGHEKCGTCLFLKELDYFSAGYTLCLKYGETLKSTIK